MLVVSDTGPINYLILIDEVELIRQLYGAVLLPKAVQAELLHRNAPLAVRSWTTHLPSWCTVVAEGAITAPVLHLEAGEQAAIEVSLALGADLLLMDDLEGRKASAGLGLRVRGTLGVLQEAANTGLIALKPTVTRLLATNFLVSKELVRRILDETAD